MKTCAIAFLLVVAASPCPAQTPDTQVHEATAAGTDASADVFSEVTQPRIAGWGKAVDPDRDCKFLLSGETLIIGTPDSLNPHDFSPELQITNAPRAVRSVTGDFSFQVCVDDRLRPGDESTLPGRVGYHGAAVIAVGDNQNIVTLARASFKRPGGDAVFYANFEIRAGGELLRIGRTNDHPLPGTGAVFLRLERQGRQVTGSVSTDGVEWSEVRSETLPDGWPDKLKVGVMVVNTSKVDFSPRFSQPRLTKPSE